MAPYAGPPTEGLDIFGLKAALISGAMDETRVIPSVTDTSHSAPDRPVWGAKGRHRRSDAGWWVVAITLFVSGVGLMSMGVYSWLVS